jgi:hypothetical protein
MYAQEAENAMPKLLEVIGGTKTQTYCQEIMSDVFPCSVTDHQIGLE